MDISLREWLIVFGMVAILLIAIDGARRFLLQRKRNPLRMRIDRNLSNLDDSPEPANNELPNGGARVSKMEPQAFSAALAKLTQSKNRAGKSRKQATAVVDKPVKSSRKEPGLSSLDVDVDPLLDDAVHYSSPQASLNSSEFSEQTESEAHGEQYNFSSNVSELHLHSHSESTSPSVEQSFPVEPAAYEATEVMSLNEQLVDQEITQNVFQQPETSESSGWYEVNPADTFETFSALQEQSEEPQTESSSESIAELHEEESQAATPTAELHPWERPITELLAEEHEAEVLQSESTESSDSHDSVVVEEQELPPQETARVLPMRPDPLADLKKQARVKADARAFSVPADEHVIISVTANSQDGFDGTQLLQVLMACGLRYGEREIFHRHEHAINKGKVQFSMANMLNPGNFDLDNIEKLQTPGVTFFMGMPGADDLMLAFECMLSTAQCLAKNLNGELKDEHHSVMRPQTIEHCRQRIREFERRQLAQPHRRQIHS
ncbi:cell division protein ZipA [Pokkaliibacter sp. CJK22405]|uniref:cell division protein ZipA n=1 Tax=Pokkaliibacter sp. CJK22405 TaxID=3384615 RepID=UPI0039853AFB